MTTRLLLPRSAIVGRAIDARALARGVVSALPLSGKSLAFWLSVSAHVAVGLALARAAHRPTVQPSPPQRALVEIAAVDLIVPDPPTELTHSEVATPAAQDSHAHASAPKPSKAPAHSRLPAAITSDALPVAVPAVIASPAAATPRFAITVGATTRTSGEASAIDSGVGAAGSGVAAEPLPEVAVDTAARLLAGSSPSYTREAAAAGVEADVPLEIVVDGAGAVTAARVLTHVGYGLDEAALRGVRAYRFAPARRAGRALAVRMRWLMRFQLR